MGVTLTDITAADFIEKENRITVYYNYETKNTLSLSLNTKINGCIETIENIYIIANTLEREIYEFFGIFFKNHSNLRKLLLDYNFSGKPFLKSFPLPGYYEFKFSMKKILSFLTISLPQELRIMEFFNSWTCASNQNDW